MKMKVELELEEKNDRRLKYFLMEGRIYKVRAETRIMDIKRLQLNDSSYIEGTVCLLNE